MAAYNLKGMSPGSAIAGASDIGAFLCVKQDTAAKTVVVTTAITSLVMGITMHAAPAGTMVALFQPGMTAKAVASTAISKGARVMADADGKITTAAGATAFDIGIANEAATNAGDIIEIEFRPMGMSPVNT